VSCLAVQRAGFAFETTLASRTFKTLLRAMQLGGYEFHLIYLWLQTPELALERVRERLRLGGHDVPEHIVRRRYERGLVNFFNIYRPIADSWLMLDNSAGPTPKPIAWRNVGGPLQLAKSGPWERLRRNWTSSAQNRKPRGRRKPPAASASNRPDHIIAAARGAILKARKAHKAAGVPIVVWRDGKVVRIRPADI
jgi:hypothetical protein